MDPCLGLRPHERAPGRATSASPTLTGRGNADLRGRFIEGPGCPAAEGRQGRQLPDRWTRRAGAVEHDAPAAPPPPSHPGPGWPQQQQGTTRPSGKCAREKWGGGAAGGRPHGSQRRCWRPGGTPRAPHTACTHPCFTRPVDVMFAFDFFQQQDGAGAGRGDLEPPPPAPAGPGTAEEVTTSCAASVRLRHGGAAATAAAQGAVIAPAHIDLRAA